MPYKNPDPGVEKDAQNTANFVDESFETELQRLIDNKYYHKSWTVLSIELRLAALKEINKIFNKKLVEIIQLHKSSDWKYKAQDVIYPKSKKKKDLAKLELGRL